MPPFPGESGGPFPGDGWRYNGSSYNGSAALVPWEANFVSNQQQIGYVRPGQMLSQPEALPLYEGFFAEIQARGYRIFNGGGAYSFRCTSSSRKDCLGLTRSKLSNHAYGLAADINVSANPQRVYFSINGASACMTPMQTDMPQWVIQVAEKWGLYWGGYGWSSGCSSPEQVKSSASRDPMHFEFNGTVEQARAILCHNLGYTQKFEVVDSSGDVEPRCFGPIVPSANTRMVIHTDAPTGATAALVNITGTGASTAGYVTAEGCEATPGGIRPWSNGNMRPGRAVAATAFVPIDSLGRFCLYQSITMHSIVDVLGFFAPSAVAPTGSLYKPITPTRTMDTRQRQFCTPESVCTSVGPINANTEVINAATTPVGAIATVANITVVQPTTPGFLTADDCSSLVPGFPPHSNVNFNPGDVVANLTLSPSATATGDTAFCTVSQSRLHQLVDVQGVFAPAPEGGLGYNSQVADRLLDTRQCWTNQVTHVEKCGVLNEGGDIIQLQAPPGTDAVVINITTASPVRFASYVSAGPCSVVRAAPPEFSNVNAVIGSDVANAAIVPVDPDGTFCVYISHPMHVLVDLLGTFSDGGALRFLPLTPTRVHDSRAPG